MATWLDGWAAPSSRRLTAAEVETVSRIVCRPLPELAGVLAHGDGRAVRLGTAGRLRVTTPFRRRTGGSEGWVARGRLSVRGRGAARIARVVIEVGPWSARACELTLRPVSRHLTVWGVHRRRRYFRLAHLAADHLAAACRDAPPPTDAGRPEDGGVRGVA